MHCFIPLLHKFRSTHTSDASAYRILICTRLPALGCAYLCLAITFSLSSKSLPKGLDSLYLSKCQHFTNFNCNFVRGELQIVSKVFVPLLPIAKKKKQKEWNKR